MIDKKFLIGYFLITFVGALMLTPKISPAWEISRMRPSVEPPRIEILLDSVLARGDPEIGLTRFVEDSLREDEERLHAATLLAALHNRREEPARALLALFFISRELGIEWGEAQSLLAAESYYRLGHADWADDCLDDIPYDNSLYEVSQTLKIYSTLARFDHPDSLLEVRSRFERTLERCSDPMALMLSVHGLGLCYFAKGTAPAYDTAAAFLGLTMADTAAAYLSFALKEYRKNIQGLPLAKRLTPYSLYWSAKAAARRGDGWGALESWEELYLNYPDRVFWDEAAVSYAALQLRRQQTDSVKCAAEDIMKRSQDPDRLSQAKLLRASALAYEGSCGEAASKFAKLSRSLEAGDTLRVLSHRGMVGALLQHAQGFFEPESVVAGLKRLDLAGYNPLAIPEVNAYLAERYASVRRIQEADSFAHRSLRYYPDGRTETRARLILAYVALAEGDYTASIDHYERVLELCDRHGFNFNGLADVRFSLGLAYLQRSKGESETPQADLRKARSSFNHAIDLDPEGEVGKAARKQLETID